MKTSPYRLPVFLLPATVLLVVLCLAPPTGWMVRTQISLLFSRPVGLISLLRDLGVKEGIPEGYPDPNQYADAQRATLERYPNDVLMQKTGALVLPAPTGDNLPLSSIRVQRLAELAQRFPNEPMLYADQLRFATQGEVGTGRQAEQQSLAQEPQAVNTVPNQKPDKTYAPDVLARYDAAAAAGEKLAPDNAYFPFMRSVGLFAAHRDAEALAAVHRAALAPHWNDYCMEEARGQELLRQRTFGEQGAIARMAVNAAILFPHFASLRAVARVVAVKAIVAEQAGQTADGFRYRHDLMRCGATMRVQSTSLIGSLVGTAIEAIAMTRPGGVPYVKPPTVNTGGDELSESVQRETMRREHLAKYVAYLESTGHADEARWATRESEAGKQMKHIADAGMKLSPFGKPLTPLMGWWVANMIILYNLFFLALLGGLALACTYKGIAERRAAKILFLTFVATAILAFRQGGPQSMAAFTMMQQVISNLSGGNSADRSFLSLLLNSGPMLSGFTCVLSLALPLLLFVAIGVASLARRRSYATELLRLLSTAGLTIACAVVVIYAGTVLQTVQAENRVNTGIERTLQHEGRYFAELLGEKWPE